MFKTLALVVAGALAFATADAARAQTFSPTSSSFDLTGTVFIQHGSFAADCTLTVEVAIDSVGYAHIIDAAFAWPSSIYCGFLVQPDSIGGWSLEKDSGDSLDFTLQFSTASGICFGTVDATYDGYSGELILPETLLNDTSAGWCTIEGRLYADPVFSV